MNGAGLHRWISEARGIYARFSKNRIVSQSAVLLMLMLPAGDVRARLDGDDEAEWIC